ncbi:hypothetical protein TBLA_0F01570 [Henningerozyma blattae CBS 6284]|uniref:Uncharacterized protein n=1 Tax=Henningerozyma blattae (strain ATCC 34711 / CBS 6284 / DSM 70876 / NBRC 10599 / NRRL Y-10934 / UCD 77-7) TaxID=1071380 RepID=I2H5P7_HENB6|nr:hypothetical protein TBLA_0F01570 [Tetrapisispora blattae CBS 6284]CCH61699.1 hypothetical protein TBLA_0F01570 [Tetrapisispora blattae CBS 6284]
MSEPLTPPHCEPDDVLDLDNLKELDERDIDDLNLNPELENSDIEIATNYANNTPLYKRKYLDEDDDQRQENRFDNVDDFKPRINVNSPFSSSKKIGLSPLNSNDTNSINQESGKEKPIIRTRRLSASQQSKFIVYCDDKLMDIQRKFVQSRGLSVENGYSNLIPLFEDIKSLIDFIWYSIDGLSNTELLLNETEVDLDNAEVENSNLPTNSKISTYFGQTSYLLKISDDLIDYLEKFDIKDLSSDEQNHILSKLFKLLFILDKIFAKLIIGSIPGNSKMSGTDIVRFCGIAERTRVRLPWYLEQQGVHGYHYEVSRIYQNSLERCGV